MATQCGFNNRNTFSSAFKKVTGKPPSPYLQSIH
ncbi:MAG: AraC family transcriptional regulator [Bacteroidota bacterium]